MRYSRSGYAFLSGLILLLSLALAAAVATLIIPVLVALVIAIAKAQETVIDALLNRLAIVTGNDWSSDSIRIVVTAGVYAVSITIAFVAYLLVRNLATVLVVSSIGLTIGLLMSLIARSTNVQSNDHLSSLRFWETEQ